MADPRLSPEQLRVDAPNGARLPTGPVRNIGPEWLAMRVITLNDVEIDAANRVVRRGGSRVTMKPKEFDLLLYLAQRPGEVFTRQHLLEQVWGYEFAGQSRTVDVHIRWLREKLEEDPSRPALLRTVRGTGYKLQA